MSTTTPRHKRQPRVRRAALLFMGALILLPLIAVLVTGFAGRQATLHNSARPAVSASAPARTATQPPARPPAAHVQPPAPARAARAYAVRAGDTLTSIAAGHHVKGGWQVLYHLNRHRIGANPNVIQPGMRLTL